MRIAERPLSITLAMKSIGDDLATWRKLRQVTVAELADHADVAVSTVLRLEKGEGSTLENLLRVARGLGLLESVEKSLDPLATDVGRMRAFEDLPSRVRRRKTT